MTDAEDLQFQIRGVQQFCSGTASHDLTHDPQHMSNSASLL